MKITIETCERGSITGEPYLYLKVHDVAMKHGRKGDVGLALSCACYEHMEDPEALFNELGSKLNA